MEQAQAGVTKAESQGKIGLRNGWRSGQGLASPVIEYGFYFTCNGKSQMDLHRVSGMMPRWAE